MWLCRFVLKLITQTSENLYDFKLLTFMLSVGTFSDSLLLLEILDDDEYL